MIQKEIVAFLKNNKTSLWYILALAALNLILFKPMVIDGKSPKGVDVVGSMNKTYQIMEHKKATGEEPLWNPFIFSGMPTYFTIHAKAPSVDTILKFLANGKKDVIWWHLYGCIGLFLLLLHLKFKPHEAFFAALLLVLIPHYKALWIEGHMMKVRAIFALPFAILAFKYFLQKRNLLSICLFAIAWGVQIRTQHYQIIFYTGLMIFAMGIYPFLKDLKEKNFAKFGISSGLLLAGIIAAIFMAAQPIFLANEYVPYSKRGKTTIDLKEGKNAISESQRKSDGVRMDYATDWSTHPEELASLLIPRYFGGMSGEVYKGDKYRQMKGQMLPLYWGTMPFTQSYEYFGIIIFLLALIGIVFNFRKPIIVSLLAFSIFLILLSFGKHFISFYEVFFNYFPYFNKFRAPSMSITINYYIFLVFAVYGLKSLSEEFDKKMLKNLYIVLASAFGLGVVLWILGSGNSFIRSGENYNQQVFDIIIDIRKDYFTDGIKRYFLLCAIASAIIFAMVKTKVNKAYLVLALLAVAAFDLYQVREYKESDFIDVKRLRNQAGTPNQADLFIKKDAETFRVFPLGEDFRDNRWGAFHQSIGGYSASKISTIEEIVQNCLYAGWETNFPINWNVVQMLNVKYLILKQNIQHPNLKLAYVDQSTGYYVFEFNKFLKRGFFVKETKVIDDDFDRLEFINTQEFNPQEMAILEAPLNESFSYPTENSVEVLDFEPNKSTLMVKNNENGLFVFSETYYPPGWKVLVNGQAVSEIYKTNHCNFSIILPKGENKVELIFEPDSYKKWLRVEYATAILLYLLTAGTLFYEFKKRKAAQ